MMTYIIFKVLPKKKRQLLTELFLEQDLLVSPLEILTGFKNLRAQLRGGKTGVHAHCPGMAILFALPFGYSFYCSLVFCLLYCPCFPLLNPPLPLRKCFSIFTQNAFGLDKYI